ncbi:MAG: hypothetical protein WC855_03380 [Thermodesulfovibrionales bacterium]
MKKLLQILLISLIMPWSINAQSNPPSPTSLEGTRAPQTQLNVKQNYFTDNQQGIKNFPVFVKIIPSETEQEKTNRERDYQDEKMSLDWIMAYSTLALACITGLLAMFTFWLWRANIKLIKSSRVQERAYLIGGGPAVNKREDTSMITIHNVGKTPGFITKVQWGLCDEKDFPFDVLVSKIINEKRLDGIKPVPEDNVWPPSSQPVGMRHVIINNHFKNVGRIFFGQIDFKDIFGDSHYSTFKLELTEDGSRTLPGSYSEDYG